MSTTPPRQAKRASCLDDIFDNYATRDDDDNDATPDDAIRYDDATRDNNNRNHDNNVASRDKNDDSVKDDDYLSAKASNDDSEAGQAKAAFVAASADMDARRYDPERGALKRLLRMLRREAEERGHGASVNTELAAQLLEVTNGNVVQASSVYWEVCMNHKDVCGFSANNRLQFSSSRITKPERIFSSTIMTPMRPLMLMTGSLRQPPRTVPSICSKVVMRNPRRMRLHSMKNHRPSPSTKPRHPSPGTKSKSSRSMTVPTMRVPSPRLARLSSTSSALAPTSLTDLSVRN